MSQFRIREIRINNFRCFGEVRLPLEEDTTVVFAENGGGKTALLTALAMGLAAFQWGSPTSPRLDARRDTRVRTLDEKGRREPVGPCKLAWTAAVGESDSVTWSMKADPASGRSTTNSQPILDALERVRVPGNRWPLFAWYGVDRFARSRSQRERVERAPSRWEAYASALAPNSDEAALHQWLHDEPERCFHAAVMEATVRATPGVTNAWYDPAKQCAVVRFENGYVAPWSELSGGYHVFIALVADIARRAVMLNEFDGVAAPARAEGVVLIDKLDLHFDPRWQRVALPCLRNTFPRLQFVVTTDSPQVLSSAENRQVRRLSDGRLQEYPVLVEGRDTNAILREHMNTDDRDTKGTRELRKLYDFIDQSRHKEAEELYRKLLARWGDLDPELIYASALIDLNE